MAVPTSVAPAKKSTFVIVPEVPGVALADNVVATPMATVDPATGAVRATVGAEGTMTLTTAEVAVAPAESVTRAVSAVTPEAVGVHVTDAT